MTPEIPVACSLDAGELPQRLAGFAAIGRTSLVKWETVQGRAELRFSAGEDTRRRLAAIVAAEAQCCSFLDMQLHDEPEAIRLTIVAPEGAQQVLDDLVAAFRGEPAGV